ncbi:MAG: TniQ family protein [Nostoc sp.]|uniref:TniQ family protein n=1 Tax=Nostoc sp. TaxID=1180 RepID=UPI002FF794F0
MLVDKLITYESWDLEKASIPSHSRLYALEPIGVGTPYVESLTGYIARLAQEHCVPTGILVLSELGPFIKEGYIFNSKDKRWEQILDRGTARALNGLSKGAVRAIQGLESLTLRNDLRFLTMLTWIEVIPLQNLLRSVKAWCPSCYENWRSTEQIIYEPLLWSLNDVTICPYHYQYLCTHCPYCHKENRLLAWSSRPGYCSECGEWLGISPHSDSADNNIKLTENELKWQMWVTENLGNLVSATQNLSPPLKGKISKMLFAYVNVLTNGNITLFAQNLGMGIVQTHRWCIGKCLPIINTLLQICFYLGTSLLDFLTTDAINTDHCTIIIRNRNQTNRKPRSSYKNSEQVKLELDAALIENPPPSLTEMAERLGYKRTTVLYYHAQDLCPEIIARHADYQVAKRLKKMQWELEAVLKSQEYPPPSMKEVARRLGKKSVHSLPNNFPELCSAISVRYASYVQERRTERVKKLSQEVRQVALQLHLEGVEPTASRISVLLKKPGSILQKQVFAAVREVRRELGWEE